MSVHAIRLHNLLVFKDSGWFEFRPVTYIYGQNSSGKSAISDAFLIMQKATRLLGSNNNSRFPGVEHFSKAFHKHNPGSLDGIALEFKCSPRLGLVSKISDFSESKDLNLQEDKEFVIFEVVYKNINGISPGDFGVVYSIAIHLFESRTAKDDLTGRWTEKKTIIGIHRDHTLPMSWVFESDFLEMETTKEFLKNITMDDSEPFPLLRAMDGDLYNLLKFSSDEFSLEQQEDENYDPYKDSDNPKNIIRYLDRFLRDVSSDVIGYIDSVKFIDPIFQKTQTTSTTVFTSNKMLQINTMIRDWGNNFGHNNFDDLAIGNFISNIISRNFDVGYDLPLGLGQLNSSRILFNLLLLERDDIAFIFHPDAFLDANNQLELADFLALCAVKDEKKIVIETHSQHLLLRIQKRLRQISNRRLPKNLEFLNGGLNHTMVGVLFCVKNLQGDSTCQTISLDEEGDFVDNWPGGFYEESTFERFDS